MTILEATMQGALEDHELESNSQGIKTTLESIGACTTCWGGLFVKVVDGEYVSVYGFKGIIPATFKELTQLVK